MSDNQFSFSAKEPTLGYLYQIRYALYLLLSHRYLDEPVLRLENLDDIEIETPLGKHLIQTKLKMKSKANLTVGSTDLWKTLRIWSEMIHSKKLDAESTIFAMVTTEKLPEKSDLECLRKRDKSDQDVESVIKILDDFASKSDNVKNKAAYQAYFGLGLEEKRKMVKNISLCDASVDIDQLTTKVKNELSLSAVSNQLDAFLENLEGWWLQQSIFQLLGKIDHISFRDLQTKILDIVDSFKSDNLPNYFADPLEISDDEAAGLSEKMYIRQLELIAIKLDSNAVKRAISDFRRAYKQRSEWIRQELLNPHEQERFDKELYDHWKHLFDILKDECLEEEEDKLVELGKSFYIESFAKKSPAIRIRERFHQDYLTRGSFHMLSEAKTVGWHPNYKDLLK